MSTVGMSRREKLQYEARIRNMTGTSKLAISLAAHAVIEDEGLIDELLRNSKAKRVIEDNKVDALMRKLDTTKPATWGDGGAYSPEVMYGTDEENSSDWENSGVADTAKTMRKEEDYG